ncbi:MAG: hypothetical protein HOP10_11005 [Chitinophagaceae bacterium]|nr:hypothetical protein [Chitinophagaceae bacterium]
MHKTYAVISILVTFVILFSQSCDTEADKSNASRHGESKSHLSGYACMYCHQPNGQSKNKFSVAGTILNEARSAIQPTAVIKLYTKSKGQGKLIATIKTDALGNFYTTKEIDFKAGLFPTLLGTPGVKEDTKHMKRRIFNGNCNGCHGPAAERLGID